MTEDIDLQAAHRHFSTHCFNAAWDLIDKTVRTSQEDEEMVRLAVTSHWHWTKRPEYGLKEASIAHWQLCRVYALVGHPDAARYHGNRALKAAREGDLPPFFEAYALEGLARAEATDKRYVLALEHVSEARRIAESVAEEKGRPQLMADLDAVERLLQEKVDA